MKREGIALVLVLVVVALMSVLVIEFSYIMRLDSRAMEYRQEDRAAYHLSRGGVSVARRVLRADSPIIDSLNDEWAKEFPPVTEGESVVSVSISDEDGKINVNRILREDGQRDPSFYGMLERLISITGADPGAAERISEELSSREGWVFYTEGELIEIEGIEDILGYLTLYTDGRININTACEVVLECLSEHIDSSLAREISSVRENTPFGSLSQLAGIPGITRDVLREISEYAKVNSSVFRIEASADAGARRKNITAVVERGREDFNVLYWRAM